MIIWLFLNFSPFCVPMKSQPCSIQLLRVSKRYSMGKRFWALLKVKNIGELLETKPHWSELILQFGTSKTFFLWIELSFFCSIKFFRSVAATSQTADHQSHITIGWSFKILILSFNQRSYKRDCLLGLFWFWFLDRKIFWIQNWFFT